MEINISSQVKGFVKHQKGGEQSKLATRHPSLATWARLLKWRSLGPQSGWAEQEATWTGKMRRAHPTQQMCALGVPHSPWGCRAQPQE